MHNATLLLVDDEAEIIKLMQIYLENERYRLFTARDGLGALEMINNETIDLMVLDIIMPNMDGIEACIKIRETQKFPIIMLSAKGRELDKIMGLSVGADDQPVKLTPREFAILELLARHRGQVLSMEQIYAKVWKEQFLESNNTLMEKGGASS
jgi:DNA-binding response OmpR family regulator